MATQTIFWTALPNGRTATELRLSVHVAPRLVATGGGDATLAAFDDWEHWPTTVASFSWKVHLATLPDPLDAAVSGPPPDVALWDALFPGTTTVRSHVFKSFDDRKIRSYNVKHVVDFIKKQYSKFADQSPEDYPSWEALAGDDAFGPVGFSAFRDVTETGVHRRNRLTNGLGGLEQQLTAAKAIAYSVVPPATPDEIGKQFLQLERFHQPRGLALVGPFVTPTPDFHDVLAFILNHPPLLRLLGLVVDLVVPIETVGAPVATTVDVVPPWTDASPSESATRFDIAPRTHCLFGDSVFETMPKDPGGDFERGHLRLANEDRFDVVVVDPDGAGLKSMMLADNLQRGRFDLHPLNKLSSASPDNYAIPSLRTGGLSLARLGIAPQFVLAMQNATNLNANAIAFDSEGSATHPDLYLDDVVRGYRFDVYDGLPHAPSPVGWKSLMKREGGYRFLNTDGGPTDVAFDDEGTFTAAPTSAADDSSKDMYLQESLMRWDGWSLVASRPGKAIKEDHSRDDIDNTAETEFGLEIRPKAKPGSLPRLRFGHTYLFRARVVDLAGNSVPFEEGASARDDFLVTPGELFTRFEPVQQPGVLLRLRRVEGESPEVIVIRSENAADDPGGLNLESSDRHVVPPRMSELMAEHHGLFDDGAFGPMTTLSYDDIKTLDEGTLDNHPQRVDEHIGAPLLSDGSPSTFIYPTSPLALNYMPDVLARKAVLRGLPATGPIPPDDGTTAMVPFENDALVDTPSWPGYRPFRIHATKAPTSAWHFFEGDDRYLNVGLAKSDIFDVRISCGGLTDDDVERLGVWQWLKDRLGAGDPSLALRRSVIQDGRHWMFTPYRELKFIHAVRTPLESPEFEHLSNSKVLGDTFTTLQRILKFHRQSTVSIDVNGTWHMPIDNGPRTRDLLTGALPPLTVETDPVTPRAFKSHAFTLPIESRSGAAGVLDLHNRHEFGDTKYRLVTYQATATSAFTEYFVEHKTDVLHAAPLMVAPALEPTTVVVRNHGGTETYRQGPEADYTVDGPAGTIERVSGGAIPADQQIDVDFVQPEIHSSGAPDIQPVLNSARPKAPKVQYIVPTFGWQRSNHGLTSTRFGNGLRVYMERPWWSSGDGEQLAVLLWRPGDDPPDLPEDPPHYADDPHYLVAPYVTMWGFDPVYKSLPVEGARPVFGNFPLRDSSHDTHRTLAERPGQFVDVAAHDVGFDVSRDLWFCDIVVNHGKSYTPFIRLALARYQDASVPDAHLSPVVLADFIQLSPTRVASVNQLSSPPRSPRSFSVSLTGRGYSSVKGRSGPGEVTVTVERKAVGVADPNLGWDPVGSPTVLTTAITDTNNVTWHGTVSVPRGAGPYRFVFDEREVLFTGRRFLGVNVTQRRLVHTDIINLL